MSRKGWGIALIFAAAVSVLLAAALSEDTGRFPSALLLPVLVLVVIFPARAWVMASTYATTVDAPPKAAMIGERITRGVRIAARRQATLQAGAVTVRCQEHAFASSGKSTAHYRRPIYERRYPVAGWALAPGEEFEVRPALEIPPSAIPSHHDHNRRIERTVEFGIPNSGLCAGIHEKVKLVVVHNIAEAGHPDDARFPPGGLATTPIIEGRPERITLGGVVDSTGEKLRGLTVLRDGLTAALETTDGFATDHRPVIPAGTTRELKVIVESQEPLHCGALRVWVGCLIGGKGHMDKLALCK